MFEFLKGKEVVNLAIGLVIFALIFVLVFYFLCGVQTIKV